MSGQRFSGPTAAGLALLLLTSLYLLTSPDSRFEADDAYNYASIIESGDLSDMMFPNHLLYLPAVKATYEPLKALLPGLRSLSFMAAIGAFIGAVAVVLFYLVMRAWLKASQTQAMAGSAALGASYGFWRYTAEAEVYALASVMALLLLLGAVKLRPGWRGVTIVALLATLAVLAHSLNVALVFVLPFLLIQLGWQRSKILFAGALFGVLLVAATYGAYAIARGHGGGMLSTTYIGFYTQTTGSAPAPGLSEVLRGVAALGSTIVAPNSLFSLESIRDAVAKGFPRNASDDEFAMGATAPAWIRYLGPLTMTSALAGLAMLIWRIRSARLFAWKSGFILLGWVVAYLAILFYAGGLAHPEVWVLVLLPMWALAVGAMARARVSGAVPWIVVGALFINSLVSGFFPLYLGENRHAILGAWFVENAGPGDLVLTADSAGLARYLGYRSEAHAAHIGIHSAEDVPLIGDLIERGATTREILVTVHDRGQVSGHKAITGVDGRLFLTRDMFSPPSWLEAANPEAAKALRALGTQVGDRFEAVPGTIYLVRVTD